MNRSIHTETTGKAEVRRDANHRILNVSARLEAMRLVINRKLRASPDLLATVAQAEPQLAAQRQVAQRSRATIAALRAAGDEAERIAEATYAIVQAAKEAQAQPATRTRAPRGQYTEKATTIFEQAGVAVRMVTYPTYRYDVVGGGEPLSVPATRRWRAERAQALAEAERRIQATA